MKPINLLFFLLTSISLSAQTAADLTGTWGYQNVYEQEKLDSTSVKMLDMLFGNMRFSFTHNGDYMATMMNQRDVGSWKFNESEESLQLNSSSGESNTFQVLELRDNKLVLQLPKGAFVFSRTAKIPETIGISQPIPAVKASREQIARKWYLKRKESPGKSEQQIELVSSLLSGAYFDFNVNGSFEVKIMGITENGEWNIGPENQSVITRNNDAQKVWTIGSISEEQLVLHPGNSEERWIFSNTH